MNALAATTQASPAPAQATPQLRTLLLTDLVDSTGTVERLGDAPSAELFRAHDRLVLDLQQRWRGRLIDRSDGLLLLFERAVDGLGFALDYNRGLRELGKAHGVPLRARAGLHVGEVLTWRNSDEAVAVGAKPLEVEGLAKPLAGRLLGLARPGQILLSATAEALAHRAARELGERGAQLAWKSHGRWRFKGLPEPLEVYEAGEPGLAPLQTPRPDAKAWRDIPAWRRPAALAAELALAAVVAIGVWFFTRPQPAIAFSERDWVVVADMRNLTGQPVLDESLQQAFRISLEQSRHVNVLSDLKARDTLARMQRQPATALDREVASEIALRDGARAVILPTVAEVGGRVRVSAEVIDPQSQTTVYAEYADGSGLGSVLASVDTVTAALRARLGEEIKAIERDSEPLPQVTTSNLDALRAYALGQRAYARGQHEQALRFFSHATDLEPGFALAWIGQVRANWASGDVPSALPALRKAHALEQRLPPREAAYVGAWVAEFDQPAEATERWTEAASLYPDFVPAQANAFIWLLSENRFEDAEPYVQRTLNPQNGSLALSYDELGRLLLATEKYQAAANAFDQALQRGNGASARRRAAVDAAQRNFEQAEKALARSRPANRYGAIEDLTIALDRGDWRVAQQKALTLLDLVKDEDGYDARSFLLMAATVHEHAGDPDAAVRLGGQAAAGALRELNAAGGANAVDDALLAGSAALAAIRLGERELAKRVSTVLAAHGGVAKHPSVEEMRAVLEAELSRSGGDPERAVSLLLPFADETSRYETRAALLRAAIDADRRDIALVQVAWLQRRRGLAYIQLGCSHCSQAANVMASNLAILDEAGLLAGTHPEKAREALERFDRIWPSNELPARIAAVRQRTAQEIGTP